MSNKKNGTQPKPKTTIAERKAQAAQELGLDPQAVKTARLEFNKLRELGIMLRVHVTGSSLFSVRALYAEYGVGDKNGESRKEVLSTGTKNLIPKALVDNRQSRETRARTLPDKFGFDDLFPSEISGWVWIPFTSWAEFQARWKILLAEDEEWKADIIARYDELREWCRITFSKSANEAWNSLVTKRKLPAGGLVVEGQTFASRELFVNFVVKDAVGKFPTVEEIKACQISYTVSVLATTADVTAEKATQAQAEAALAEAHAKVDTERTAAQMRAEAAKIKIAAMRQAEIEAARAQLAEAQPMADFMARVRGRVLESLQKVKETIQSTGTLPPKTADLAMRLPEIYNQLSAGVSDAKAEALMAELKSAVGTSTEKRSMEEITRAMTELENELSRNVVEIMKAEPNRFQHLEMDW